MNTIRASLERLPELDGRQTTQLMLDNAWKQLTLTCIGRTVCCW